MTSGIWLVVMDLLTPRLVAWVNTIKCSIADVVRRGFKVSKHLYVLSRSAADENIQRTTANQIFRYLLYIHTLDVISPWVCLFKLNLLVMSLIGKLFTEDKGYLKSINRR